MKNTIDVEKKVKSIIYDKLRIDQNEITPQMSFINDLHADSLDTVEIIMEFEKEFNITIPDNEATDLVTVGDAIAYISKKIELQLT